MPRIEAVIFDLDDTLYDCSGTLVNEARRRAARAMIDAGLKATEEDILKLQEEYEERLGPRTRILQRVVEHFGGGDEVLRAALKAYNSDDVGKIQPFPDVISTLNTLRAQGLRVFLVTVGTHARQEAKIGRLGIRKYFDEIVICDTEIGDRLPDWFRYLLRQYNLHPSNVLVVGDRLHEEIRVGNEFGMTTVQFLHGRYKDLKPTVPTEKPDVRVRRIFQVPAVISLLNAGLPPDGLRVVAIGGGTGMPIVLEGLKCFTNQLTAIVTVTDTGRSSGVLRKELDVPPPGDARNCLAALTEIVALSESEERERYLFKLFNYRFQEGHLKGMSLGNLLMAALTEITGSFQLALEKASSILGVTGRVLPSTADDVHICAQLEDGSVVCEELNVRAEGKPRIQRAFLKPSNPKALPDAVEEIHSADLVVIGPGSLYTSVITNLLVPEIGRAIHECNATVVYVCNVMTQPGQTDDYTLEDHVRAIVEHVGEGAIDYVLLNTMQPPKEAVARYAKEGARLVEHSDGDEIMGAKVVRGDLVEQVDGQRILWEKRDLLRHDPDKLAAVLLGILALQARQRLPAMISATLQPLRESSLKPSTS